MNSPETPKLRFAFYGRLSTTDKQDPALSFPSQLSACRRKAAELGGEITCEFTDQQSGATIDRPGWMALAQEATEPEKRRFDAVVIYSTSRLARDIHVATLFARDLDKQQVPIHYATGGGDPSTPEGEMFIGMQHLWDQFERAKLSRETKRGMREGAGQGYRMGGRAPYGYMRQTEDLPEGHLGDTNKKRVRLVPHPEEAEVVTEIFDMHAHLGMSTPQIADELNRRKIPSPKAVSRTRNPKHVWSASTIRTMLKNEIYTGRMIWDRLDFATIRKNGGGTPKLRAREEWKITENAHLPLVTDETFQLSQEKFKTAPPRKPASKKGKYLFAGMVHCSCGHQPLSMHGKSRKGHLYYACNYGDYGETAAIEAHNGQKWIYLREDVVEPFVMRFFAQRIFGPMRIEKLAKQLEAERSKKQTGQKALATRLRAKLTDIDQKIKAQVIAIEEGVEPQIVAARITELKEEKQEIEQTLSELDPAEIADEDDGILERLHRIPDLSKQLTEAPREVQRQVFEAFELRVEYNKAERHLELSATVSEELTKALETEKALFSEDLQVTFSDIAGAGFEPATFGL